MILRLLSGILVTATGFVAIVGDLFSEGAISQEIGAPGWLILFVGLLLLESAGERE